MKKTIVLHDGIFHADDVVCAALFQIKYGKDNCEIIRTRNQEKIESADIVADVGMVYNPESNRFDHHQADVPVYANGVKYAACGMVLENIRFESGLVQYLLDNGLYQVQALDNGQEIDSLVASPFVFVSHMNATWEFGVYSTAQSIAFNIAVDMARTILVSMIDSYESKKKAAGIVKEAIKTASENNIVLEQYVPWQDAVIEYNNSKPAITTVVFQSKPGDWKVQVVPKEKGSFEAWVELDPEKCAAIPGFVFCHAAKFLAGFTTKESALRAVETAVNLL